VILKTESSKANLSRSLISTLSISYIIQLILKLTPEELILSGLSNNIYTIIVP
jgi:hypothetical protein